MRACGSYVQANGYDNAKQKAIIITIMTPQISQNQLAVDT